jgi:hypothetical protein
MLAAILLVALNFSSAAARRPPLRHGGNLNTYLSVAIGGALAAVATPTRRRIPR